MEKILEYRISHEHTVMEKYSLLQKDLSQHKEKLHSIIGQYENIKKAAHKKKVEELRQQLLYMQKIEEEIELQNELIKRLTAKIETTRLELIEAQKHRKMLEKLKEKDYEKYKEMIKSLEQKELDELAVLKFNKK